MTLYEPRSGGYRTQSPVDIGRCREEVYEGISRNFGQCARKKAVEVDGIGYCKQHSPAAKLERERIRREKYEADADRSRRKHERPTDYMNALREIAAGHNDPRALAKTALEKWGDS